MIEASISKLSVLRRDVMGWWEERMRTSAEALDFNADDLGDWGIPIQPADQPHHQRMKDLLAKIEFEISMCEQFRSINAEHLQVENILNDDDSVSVASNLASETTHSEPTELPSVYPNISNDNHTTSVGSNASLRRLQYPSQIHSRSSSALSGSISQAIYMNDTAGIPTLASNEVFLWTPLRMLSENLFSNASTGKFGMPTVFSVAGVIAIGTSRSMILVYDLTQALIVVLGDLSNAIDFGAVTSIAISMDHSKIVAGYSSGVISVWDFIKKQNIKTIQPLPRTSGASGESDTSVQKRGHFRNSKIIHVSFVGSKVDVVSADDEGSAFIHSITSMMMLSSISSTQLAGNQPIYAISPLPRSQRTHPTDSARIIAVATPFRLTFIRLRPVPTVFHKILAQKNLPLEERTGSSCASLAWRPALTVGKTMSVPALAATFNSKLSVYMIVDVATNQPNTIRKSMDFEVKEVGTWDSDEPIVAIHWINFNTLGLLTTQESLIVVDTIQMRELERCSAKKRSLLFHDYFSKSLEGLGIIPEMAYFQNFKSYKGRLFILGLNSIEVASLSTWNDRLTSLVKLGNYKGALEMGSGFYNGLSFHAVSGLPSDADSRKQAVGAFLAQVLSTFVSMSLSSTDFEMSSQDFAFVRDLAATSFRICLMIQDEELLFGEIFEWFREAGVSQIFLDELEDYVLKEGLSVRLNRPDVIQQLVAYFSSQGWYSRLEQLLVHIDPSSMDINQILRLCEEHSMFSALIYVYTNSVKDYVAPLISLLSPVDVAIKAGTIEDYRKTANSGYIVFVYLAYIFTGKSFPVGTLTRREALQAKSDLYNFLFSTTHTSWPPGSSNSQPNTDYLRALGCEPYPYVRLLLQYDSKELFNLLALAFEDSSLDGEIRLRDGHAQDGRVRFADLHSELNRQFIVDTLLMISHSELPNPRFKLQDQDLIQLYAFIAKSYSKYGKEESRIGLSGSSSGIPPAIQISNQTCKDIFHHLLSGFLGDEYPILREERQTALCAMLNVYNPCKTALERESILNTCHKVAFWRVAEQLYKLAGQYEMIIQCYLNDEGRKGDVFQCLSNLLVGGELEYSETWGLKQHMLEMLVPLIEVDGTRTAELVINVFPSENDSIVARLKAQPKSQYMYLRGLLEYELTLVNEIRGQGGVMGSGRRGSTTIASGGRLTSRLSQGRLTGGIQSQYFTVDLYNLFINLMIQYEPLSVLPFLVNTARQCEKEEQASDPYDFQVVLSLCLDANLKAPALWMLERNGLITRALDIILNDLTDSIGAGVAIVKDDVARSRSPSPSPASGLDLLAPSPFAERSEALNQKRLDLQVLTQNMSRDFDAGLALCQRKASSLEKWERDSLWYRLLDSVLEPHNDLRLQARTPYYDPVEAADGSRTPTAVANNTILHQLMTVLRSFLRKTVKAMVLHIKLPAILVHLLNSMNHSRFGELRRTIFIMIEEYSFESQLFATASRILSDDAYELNKQLVRHRHQGFRPMKGQCGVCRRLLHIDTAAERVEELSDHFCVFECQHIFHERCLRSEIDSKNADLFHFSRADYWCVVCEVLNENGVRTFKRQVVDRLRIKEKGKQPLVAISKAEPISTNQEPPIDLERIYKIFDAQPSSGEIFSTLDMRDADLEDHISLNESFDDTDTSSTMHASTLAPISRRLPPRILKMLDGSLKQFDLVLDPPNLDK
ncbi:Golgi CORVET complex core vacuolar protein 8-domain-containing protein [Obelidium mucronatum]|nr:Golgi CORVET complex core vacuolar protein 8-domain-containing protein [Obelidium mucronatum]